MKKNCCIFLSLCCTSFPSEQKLPNGSVPKFAQNLSETEAIKFSEDMDLQKLITDAQDPENLIIKIGDDYFDGLYVIENKVNHVAGIILNYEEAKKIQSQCFGVNGKYVFYQNIFFGDETIRRILSNNGNVTRLFIPKIDPKRHPNLLKELLKAQNLCSTLKTLSVSCHTPIPDDIEYFPILTKIIVRNDSSVLSNACLTGTPYGPTLPADTKINNPFYQQDRFVIPPNIQYIYDGAFHSFTDKTIERLYIPDTVQQTGDAFFSVKNPEISAKTLCKEFSLEYASAMQTLTFYIQNNGQFESFNESLKLPYPGQKPMSMHSAPSWRDEHDYIHDYYDNRDVTNARIVEKFVCKSNGQTVQGFNYHNLDKRIFEQQQQRLESEALCASLIIKGKKSDFSESINFLQNKVKEIDDNEKTWRTENEKIFENIDVSQKFQDLFVYDDSKIKVSKNLDDHLHQIRNRDTGYYDFSQIFETSDIPIILTCLSSDGPSFVKDYLTYCKQNDDLEKGLLLVRMAIFAARLFHTNWQNFLCDDLFDQDPYFLPELTKFFLPFELRVPDNSYPYQLIKEDNIKDFIIWINTNNISLSTQLGKSLSSSLFNLALSCGAIQIVKYLSQNGIDIQNDQERNAARDALAISGNATLLHDYESDLFNKTDVFEKMSHHMRKCLRFCQQCLENGHVGVARYVFDNYFDASSLIYALYSFSSCYYMADSRVHDTKISALADFSDNQQFSKLLYSVSHSSKENS